MWFLFESFLIDNEFSLIGISASSSSVSSEFHVRNSLSSELMPIYVNYSLLLKKRIDLLPKNERVVQMEGTGHTNYTFFCKVRWKEIC